MRERGAGQVERAGDEDARGLIEVEAGGRRERRLDVGTFISRKTDRAGRLCGFHLVGGLPRLQQRARDAKAGFARGLAQVMARDLQPQRIHVAYINVDGPIDMPFIRQRVPNIQEEDMLKPSAIAESYWHLAHQDPSAWTHELDVRPFTEKF